MLFGLRVLCTSLEARAGDTTSFFGIPVPAWAAVWVELLVVQLAVPQSSFLGHLAGILAGTLLARMIAPPSPAPAPARPAPRTWRSLLLPAAPGTVAVCMLQAGLHYGLVGGPGTVWPPLQGCLPTRLHITVRRLGLAQLAGLLLAPLHHLGPVHLAANLASLWLKSRLLEAKLGVTRWAGTLLLCLLASSLLHLAAGRLAAELGHSDLLPPCSVGLSSALFALKVITLAHCRPTQLTALFELSELVILAEKNSRLYHCAGLGAGALLLWLLPALTRPASRSRHAPAQPDWTRSWGYSGPRPAPAPAPPARPPPSPAGGPAPPPPGPAFRLDSAHSRSLTDDELRRRRLERFS